MMPSFSMIVLRAGFCELQKYCGRRLGRDGFAAGFPSGKRIYDPVRVSCPRENRRLAAGGQKYFRNAYGAFEFQGDADLCGNGMGGRNRGGHCRAAGNRGARSFAGRDP